MIIESCHELVPPEEIKPITEKIINNYITEYCQNQHITVGLNTIREILARMPLALDEAQIEYLVEFRHFKKNNSVRVAGKSASSLKEVTDSFAQGMAEGEVGLANEKKLDGMKSAESESEASSETKA